MCHSDSVWCPLLNIKHYEFLCWQLKDMHTLEEDRQEVVQWNQEGVGPLAGEVRREGRVLLGGMNKRQDEPITPVGLTLQLLRLLLEKLLSLLQVSSLMKRRMEDGGLTVKHSVTIKRIKHVRSVLMWCYLDGADDVVSVQAGSQFVDSGSVHILQSAEQTSVQVQPVLLQTTQVKHLDEMLQLVDDLIHLRMETSTQI